MLEWARRWACGFPSWSLQGKWSLALDGIGLSARTPPTTRGAQDRRPGALEEAWPGIADAALQSPSRDSTPLDVRRSAGRSGARAWRYLRRDAPSRIEHDSKLGAGVLDHPGRLDLAAAGDVGRRAESCHHEFVAFSGASLMASAASSGWRSSRLHSRSEPVARWCQLAWATTCEMAKSESIQATTGASPAPTATAVPESHSMREGLSGGCSDRRVMRCQGAPSRNTWTT